MSNKEVKHRLTKNPSKPTKRKPVNAQEEHSSKKKKNHNSASVKVKNGVHEPKSCHQCHRNDQEVVLKCKKCQLRRYCVSCITKWYPNVSQEEFVKACPVCCNICNCKACLRRFSPKDMQGYSCSKPDKVIYSKQILLKVFPLVTNLNEDQLIEREIEANVKGVPISELHLQDADCEVDDDIFCDKCGSYSFDLYRSCACGYDLCLACCKELRNGQLKGLTCGWKARVDGTIPCPPKDIGGCNDGTLQLKRIMCINRIENLVKKAQGVYKSNKTKNSYDNPQTCMGCSASYLHSFSAKDIQPQHVQHFRYHWSKGEPIIVNDVLSTSLGLSWEPMVLWRAFRDIPKSSNHSHAYEVNAINCLDWSEVTVDLSKICKEYSAGQFETLLKLEDWQPSCVTQQKWPRHFVEFVNCLPFKDYTNPNNGYLNVAVKLPYQSAKPDMGPKMDIAYGVEKELEYGDSVTKLHYEKSDTVNVLTHTKSGVLTPPKLNKTKMVKQKHDGEEYVVNPMEGSALWDIFQRRDVPLLEEYLRNHSAEFRHTDRLSVEQVIHPIHDRTFYLNMEHKRKLKEEFGIEPWTFKQKVGDAVFIPAGCPYQVRNLKSSTKVELNFLSRESLDECIRLQEELRTLPNNHRAKQQKLNVGKMMIYALDQVVAELSEFIDSDGPTTNDLQDLFARTPDILNGDDMDMDMNINNHTNGWVCDSENEENISGNQPDSIEASGTSKEPIGLWHGNDIGHEAKEILHSVEHHYPETFQRLQIRSNPLWLSILKELHVFIKAFLQAPVEPLEEEKITSLEADLNDFERFGFDLSWARNRLDMVKKLKYGNDPLRLELEVLEGYVKVMHKELVEANVRLEKARVEYNKAVDERKKKVDEVVLKFGARYDDVLNGNLGFGMLPGY